MANYGGYIPSGDVITDAAQSVGDPQGAIVGRPRYLGFVQKALSELCFDAEWDRRYHDTEVPSNRIVEDMPRFVNGLRNIWLYNGDTCDEGNTTNTARVQLKENYVHDGGNGYFANNKYFNFPNATQLSAGLVEPFDLFYGGWVDGVLYLSQQCSSYARIRIEYVGMGIDKFCQEAEVRVPNWAREAVEHYVAMRAAQHILHHRGKSNTAWAQFKDFKEEYKSATGSWMNARMRWASMDYQDRYDMVTYTSRFGYPV